ncbi:acyltransferase family protein [Paenibacillus polysaccharolyticus]|uniref:acyltransferase family protein n=1 Tax=Paenibacillus polysaccharolyticus TaxID=582692 RepID=UPI00280B0112|nr:acyltransferase family protein [Paenibacillus polysaccharolyticus]
MGYSLVNNKRIEWVDVFRGIVILLVVIGHQNGWMVKYAYLFHMPALFFISGYVTKFNNSNLFEFTKNRFLRLIVPFIWINIFFFIFRWGLNILGYGLVFYKENMSFADLMLSIKQLFTHNIGADLAGVSWFFVVLFLVSVIHKALHLIFKSNKIWISTIAIAMFCVGYYLVKHHIIFEKSLLDLALIAQFYFYIGWLIPNSKFSEWKIKDYFIKYKYVLFIVAVILMYYFANYKWGGTDYPSRSFGNPLINILSAVSGIIVTYLLSVSLLRVRRIKYFLIYCGKSTMTIAFFHFLAFRLAFLLFFYLGFVPREQLQALIPEKNSPHLVLLFIFTISFCLLMNELLKKISITKMLFLGENTKEQKQLSILIDFFMKPIIEVVSKVKDALIAKIKEVTRGRKYNINFYIAVSIIVVLKLIFFMRSWINVNDELLILLNSQRGFSSVVDYIYNVSVSQGRAYFVGSIVASIIFTIKSVWFFKVVCVLILFSNVITFIMLCNKFFKESNFSWLIFVLFSMMLSFSWEPGIPNAYTAFYGLSLSFLFLSLYSYFTYIEKQKMKYIIIASVGYLMCLFTYELFALYFPVFFIISMYLLKSIKQSFYKLIPLMGVSAIYLIIYFIWRSIYGAGYDGASVEGASIFGLLYTDFVLSLTSIPGSLLLNAKYRYILFEMYGDGQGILNMLIDIFSWKNLILGAISYYITYYLIQRINLSRIQNKMIAKISWSIIYIFLPSSLLAITPLYQEAVSTSAFLSVTSSYFSLFAIVLLIALLGVYIMSKYGSKEYSSTVKVLLSLFISLLSILSMFQSDVITQHQGYLKEKLKFVETFIQSDEFKIVEPGSTVYAPSIFESEMSLAIHDTFWDEFTSLLTGKNVHFAKELDDSINGSIYYLRNVEISSRQERYLVFGRVLPDKLPLKFSDEAMILYSGKGKEFTLNGLISESGKVGVNSSSAYFDDSGFQFDLTNYEAIPTQSGHLKYSMSGRMDLDSLALVPGQHNNYKIFKSSVGTDMKSGLKSLDWYPLESDGSGAWIGKEASIKLHSGDKGKLKIDGYMTNYIESNGITVIVDGEKRANKTVKDGNFSLEISIPKNQIVDVKLVSKFTMVPAELGINSDTRELSFLINNIVTY